MSKLSIFYLNDRKIPVRVSIETLHDGDDLQPAQGKEFEVDIPEGRMLFVKAWEHGQVILGTVPIPEKEEALSGPIPRMPEDAA